LVGWVLYRRKFMIGNPISSKGEVGRACPGILNFEDFRRFFRERSRFEVLTGKILSDIRSRAHVAFQIPFLL